MRDLAVANGRATGYGCDEVKRSVVLTAAIGAIVVCALALSATSASAARQPTVKERTAITFSLPTWLRHEPVGCVWLDIRVSNNGRYARVVPNVLNGTKPPCLRYAANGYWILKKTATWKIVFNGSDFPLCSEGIPRDLVQCRRR
jgi:hypothetical protein